MQSQSPPRVHRIGSYLLGRKIGSGGMSSVFAALQRSALGADRLVALKVLGLPLADDPSFRALFAREASIATRLEHPHIVRTYDVGEADGQLYLAMEYLHGARLSQLQATPVPLAIALRIACDLAAGLHAAHELRDTQGSALHLVHQDVTPQNVIIGYDGATKLLDFGVARLCAIDGSRTLTVRGKPAYLAPEQITGGRIDRRTDVFALGVLLHELVTGARLFKRDTEHATYAAILVADIRPVCAARPDLPAALGDAIARALARDPGARFGSAAELRARVLEVAEEAGLPLASAAAVGAWARRVAPATFTPGDLERELGLGGEVAADAPLDVFDLPTIAPGLPAGAADADEKGSRSWARALPVAVLAAGGIAIAAFAARGAREAPPPVVAVAAAAPPVVTSPPLIEAKPAELPPPAPSSAEAEEPAPAGAPAAARRPVRRARAPVAERRVAAPPAAPAAESGAHLSVWSSVWGAVSLDGTPVGDSPVIDIPVRTGRHTVSVKTSQGTKEQAVSLEPGESEKVRFVF